MVDPALMEKSREPFLIQRIRAGERNHFHELIRPYERRAFLIAYSILRNQDDAEDAVQQSMLKIFLHLEQLAETDKFAQWAMRIVENEARMSLLSGYKLNRFSWLEKHGKSSWEPIC